MIVIPKHEFATREEALKAARMLVAQLENEELANVETENRRLREALKPFADYATNPETTLTDADWDRAIRVMKAVRHG